VNLSPLLDGVQPPKRTFAYGGYSNWLYARTDGWAFVSENRGRGRRLYDLDRDPGEAHNLARRHPRLIDDLYRRVVRRAGGRPPIYRT
jgi:arylsulfatase A-like enzyme